MTYMSYVLYPQQRSPTIALFYCYFDPTTGQGRCQGVQVEFSNYDMFMRFRQSIENLMNELMSSAQRVTSQTEMNIRSFGGQTSQGQYITGLEMTITEKARSNTRSLIPIPLY